MGWTAEAKDWVGKVIISQFGLVCDVKAVHLVEDKVFIVCVARHNGKTWNWTVEEVTLVTRDNKIVDYTGEVYGELAGKDWELYPDEKCYFLSPEALNEEFSEKH